MSRRLTLVLIVCTALTVWAAWLLLPRFTGTVVDAGQESPTVGFQAPDFALTDLNGRIVRLSSFRGRPVYLNFWASWCSACQAEFPDLQAAYAAYGKSGRVVFLTVNYRESGGAAASYLRANNYSVPVLLDLKGQVAERYWVRGIPTSLFIAPDGVIRDKVVGGLSAAGFRVRLDALVAKK